MNYEQKYKEALERANEAVKRGMVSQNFVDDIFGVEGEDERIRKFLIEKFSKLGEIWPEYSTKTILAYLEKQKEQEPEEWSEVDILTLDSIISIVEDWESEQSEEEKEYYGATQKSDFLKSLPERFNLQPKQEWSEEDETILRLIHEALSCAYSVKNMDTQTCSVMREWLNNRFRTLRPSWKPSEEQMEQLKLSATVGPEERRKILDSLYEQLKAL